MSVKMRDIMWIMEDMAPSRYAEDWDNVGLNVGDEESDINKILIALDATEDVIDEAIEKKADLIITHHPLLFHSTKKITQSTIDGRKIIRLIKNNINHFAAHTNLDAVHGGTNDVLAEILGVKDLKVLSKNSEDGLGIGRVGIIDDDMTVGMLAVKVKEELGLDAVRVVGNLSRKVENVALCTGAGASFMKDVIEVGSDVYITSDIRYHEAQEAIDYNIAIIDATHYSTENVIVPTIASYIKQKLENRGIKNVEVIESKVDGQIFVHI